MSPYIIYSILYEGKNQALICYKKLKQKLDEYSMDEAQRAREIEFAKFEVDEIEQADLKGNEDVDLETTYKKMAGAKDVAVELSSIYQLISCENENGVGSQINRAISLINSVKSDDESLLTELFRLLLILQIQHR